MLKTTAVVTAMVRTQWYTRNGTHAMVRTQWYTRNGTHAQWYTRNGIYTRNGSTPGTLVPLTRPLVTNVGLASRPPAFAACSAVRTLDEVQHFQHGGWRVGRDVNGGLWELTTLTSHPPTVTVYISELRYSFLGAGGKQS